MLISKINHSFFTVKELFAIPLNFITKEDILFFVTWWFFIFIIGFIFLPLTARIFRNFFDRGYNFSKCIGILISSYLTWLLSSLRIFPFWRVTIFLVLFIACLTILKFSGWFKNFAKIVRKNTRWFIAEEALFLGILIFWTLVRALRPDIQGLEKYMDFGFINSILRSDFMPPQDMWFAGSPINYYYFGHFISAFLIRLTGIKPAVGFNLMLATIFSLTLCLVLSLVSNLRFFANNKKMKNAVFAGLVTALLIGFGSNLHTFVYAQALPFLKTVGIHRGEITPYKYYQTTRYIGYNPETQDKTIHEFPAYSFVVSDLHAHLLNLPFVITLLGVILGLWFSGPKFKWRLEEMGKVVLVAFVLAVFYMINSWDFFIYFAVVGLMVLYRHFSHDWGWKVFISAFGETFVILLFAVLFSLPFNLHFKIVSGGIHLVKMRTPFYQLLILWGYQWFFVAYFFLHLFRQWWFRRHTAQYGSFRGFVQGLRTSDAYVVVLAVSAIGFIVLPEILYLKDIYNQPYLRANTMFKFTYQSAVLFYIVCGYVVAMIFTAQNRTLNKYLVKPVALCFLILPLLYPFYSFRGYYKGIQKDKFYGLDGIAYLKKADNSDWEAINWFNENINGQPTILEMGGKSFSDYGRISMATGLPTILGWAGHEWLWRKDRQDILKRIKEVETVYRLDDIRLAKEILQRYGVRFIIIGEFERKRFENLKEEQIISLGRVAFTSPTTKIVKVDY